MVVTTCDVEHYIAGRGDDVPAWEDRPDDVCRDPHDHDLQLRRHLRQQSRRLYHVRGQCPTSAPQLV